MFPEADRFMIGLACIHSGINSGTQFGKPCLMKLKVTKVTMSLSLL